jgi:protoheme IX farnesyltransferase
LIKAENHIKSLPVSFQQSWKDLVVLTKLRLSSTVVFSAGMGYLMALGFGGAAFSFSEFCLLLLGGLLVTAAANAINQVVERETDAKMERTKDRPIAAGRMRATHGLLIAGLCGLLGTVILGLSFGPLPALLGILAMISYGLVYTPMKRMTPLAVFVGAFPGAMPPLIGWTAVSGEITSGALALFAIQFFWQFPHFWAIAWLSMDDYAKAGFKLLPDSSGRTKASAVHIVIYTAMLIPVGLLPFFGGMIGWIAATVATLCAAGFLWKAFALYQKGSMQSARSLLFYSFAYLPLVQLAMVIDKIP